MTQRDWVRDVAAFQGASYFRAVGKELQYGMSARGLAINCGLPMPEEFPVFTTFYFERPAPDSPCLSLFAMLDSPSATGVYRFQITPAATLVMEIDATVYPARRSSASASPR